LNKSPKHSRLGCTARKVHEVLPWAVCVKSP